MSIFLINKQRPLKISIQPLAPQGGMKKTNSKSRSKYNIYIKNYVSKIN